MGLLKKKYKKGTDKDKLTSSYKHGSVVKKQPGGTFTGPKESVGKVKKASLETLEAPKAKEKKKKDIKFKGAGGAKGAKNLGKAVKRMYGPIGTLKSPKVTKNKGGAVVRDLPAGINRQRYNAASDSTKQKIKLEQSIKLEKLRNKKGGIKKDGGSLLYKKK